MSAQMDVRQSQMSVAVIGLGSMGLGIARSLQKAGFNVVGYDPSAKAMGQWQKEGGRLALNPAGAAQNSDVVVSVVVTGYQTRDVLFGPQGVGQVMKPGSVFISSATMGPDDARELAALLEAHGVHYLDAPISGGAAKAHQGSLTIMASGSRQAFDAGRSVLEAMAAKTYELGDAAGAGSAYKMINQLLAGVHIAVACEAIALAAKQGLDLSKVYEVITASAGNSWMFENRIPHVLAGDYHPLSAVDIFVKDLGIVQDIGRSERFPVPLAAAALQMFLAASGSGFGRQDDASVARVYAALSNAELPIQQSK